MIPYTFDNRGVLDRGSNILCTIDKGEGALYRENIPNALLINGKGH